MKHLIEDSEGSARIGRRMISCQYDDGKFAHGNAFGMLDGGELYVISPCNMCHAFFLKMYTQEEKINKLSEKTIVYRGYMLLVKEGFEVPKRDSPEFASMLKEIDGYIESDGKDPMLLRGLDVLLIQKLESIK